MKEMLENDKILNTNRQADHCSPTSVAKLGLAESDFYTGSEKAAPKQLMLAESIFMLFQKGSTKIRQMLCLLGHRNKANAVPDRMYRPITLILSQNPM